MFRWFVVALAFIVVTLCGCSTGSPAPSTQSAPDSPVQELGVLQKKPLNDYTWSDLTEISSRIATAGSDEEGRAIAKEFGLVEEDGRLSLQTKQIVLNETRALDIRLAGIRHDNKSDGSGKAGLTFMTVGALDIRPMNDQATVEGGWEASALRVHEVCGDVTWDIEEFRQRRGYEDIDGLLNAEGEQYEVFAQAGVTGDNAADGFLSLANSTGTSPWWYRTPYPFEWHNLGPTGNDGFFYRVMDSGYPKSIGSPNDPSSVVICFSV